MDTQSLLDFARGPLFALTFLVMLVGLARHVIVQIYLLASSHASHRGGPWRRIIEDSAAWILPIRHLVSGTLTLTVVSFVFHAAAIAVVLFFEGHIVLWESLLGFDLPALGLAVSDALTFAVLACGCILLLYRLVVARARALSSWRDYGVLAVTLLPFLTGWLSAHPAWSPLPWAQTMLLHVLSAELLFVVVPFSKLAHMVLFPFVRISPVYWNLQPGAGAKAATAVFGHEGRTP